MLSISFNLNISVICLQVFRILREFIHKQERHHFLRGRGSRLVYSKSYMKGITEKFFSIYFKSFFFLSLGQFSS
jgi:hypothetical protein